MEGVKYYQILLVSDINLLLYLPKWGVDIKEESPVDIPAGHLAKMSFIPAKMNMYTKKINIVVVVADFNCIE